MKFIEETESAWSAEQLAAAAREIEDQKREWEQNRLAAMREEEERRARELDEDADMLTYTREDATNQVSTKTKKLKTKRVAPKFKRRRMNIRTRTFSESGQRTSRRQLVKAVAAAAAADDSDAGGGGTRLNGDTDSGNSRDSVQSESDLTLAALKAPSNHVDQNSPRTRSRGTVAINLWTLDVSPILPGVKPVKNQINNVAKRAKDTSDDDDDDDVDTDVDHPKRYKIKANVGGEGTSGAVDLTSKICKVVLNDIIADGQYKMPADDPPQVVNNHEEPRNDEKLKENIENSNIPNSDSDIKASQKKSFKPPDCRKSYKAILNNRTLDSWVSRSPPVEDSDLTSEIDPKKIKSN